MVSKGSNYRGLKGLCEIVAVALFILDAVYVQSKWNGFVPFLFLYFANPFAVIADMKT